MVRWATARKLEVAASKAAYLPSLLAEELRAAAPSWDGYRPTRGSGTFAAGCLAVEAEMSNWPVANDCVVVKIVSTIDAPCYRHANRWLTT